MLPDCSSKLHPDIQSGKYKLNQNLIIDLTKINITSEINQVKNLYYNNNEKNTELPIELNSDKSIKILMQDQEILSQSIIDIRKNPCMKVLKRE